MRTVKDLSKAEYYINRELSQLAFNRRVLSLAQDPRLPLLERFKFLFICASNLDEFFEIRVAGVKELIALRSKKISPDGMTPEQTHHAISQQAHTLVEDIYTLLNKKLLPQLENHGIRVLQPKHWNQRTRDWVKHYFRDEILPVLSPVGLDHAHPFPRLVNKSLNFMVSLEGHDAFGRSSGLAIVHAPRALARVIKVPEKYCRSGENFILLTSIIQAQIHDVFPGMKVKGCYQFRLTRNSDLFFQEEEIEDLALTLKTELFQRHYGNVVRLEIDKSCPASITQFLLDKHQIQQDDVYYCDGPVNLSRYMTILKQVDHQELSYESFQPSLPARLEHKHDLFAAIRDNDILLHHPYQSFNVVVDFIRQATLDPDVIAIKQTLYRTHPRSIMVQALIEAARAGKEVTAVIELRARFDEESNIRLANHLQEAGALVVYGVVGFKTHAKMTLVVRREKNKLRRYAHLGTGNYHERTAKEYTDIGLLTYNNDVTRDVQKLFQTLTGMGKTAKLAKLYHSPFTWHKLLLELIEFETLQAKKKRKAHIIIKVNGLTDPKIIQALYKASQAGVKIDLIVRSICCLRPGIKGVSDNIKVHSIVGRFLEHSRVFYFYHDGDDKLFCGSADLMERNLYHRVEVCFPILDPELAKRVKSESLDLYLKDNINSWRLLTDGDYQKLAASKRSNISAQETLLNKLT